MTFLLLRKEKYKFSLKQNILTFEKNILNGIVQKGISMFIFKCRYHLCDFVRGLMFILIILSKCIMHKTSGSLILKHN